MRTAMQDGSNRATTWSSLNPLSFTVLETGELYIGITSGVVKYADYLDGTTKYQLRYFSNPIDFGNTSNLKFLKKFNLVIVGGQNTTTTLNWGYDYTEAYTKQVFVMGSSAIAEYGISEYNTNREYTAHIEVNTPRVNTSGNGEVVTVGIEAEINASPFSIQKIDIHALLGRLI
jgi:hypothetical protein